MSYKKRMIVWAIAIVGLTVLALPDGRAFGNSAWARCPELEGSTDAWTLDGKGGWYVSNSNYDDNHNRAYPIVHKRSDGSTDPAWHVSANQYVAAMADSTDGATLFVGGWFTTIGGQHRNRMAALDAATGAVKPWTPSADDHVRALALSRDGTTIYAGGAFRSIEGKPRNHIGAINVATGSATPWNPNANGEVWSLSVSGDGKTVYAAGFTGIGGQSRHVAALDNETGVPSAFNPEVDGGVEARPADAAPSCQTARYGERALPTRGSAGASPYHDAPPRPERTNRFVADRIVLRWGGVWAYSIGVAPTAIRRRPTLCEHHPT